MANDKVRTCYDLLDASVAGGVSDFTEGIWSNGRRSYASAQQNQAEYLLDQAGCRKESVILDIGCGYGRILKAAEARGASATGITISARQVKRCRESGLDVHLMNYTSIPRAWTGRFDAIIINGAIEHFVLPEWKDRQDEIYKNLFAICHRILKSRGKMVTTTIHFRDARKEIPFEVQDVLDHFGGYYPAPGQLRRDAQGFFDLVQEIDGTRDYAKTSAWWLAQMRKKIKSSPKTQFALLKKFMKHPIAGPSLLACLVQRESWNKQFQGTPPPTILLRQTWTRTSTITASRKSRH